MRPFSMLRPSKQACPDAIHAFVLQFNAILNQSALPFPMPGYASRILPLGGNLSPKSASSFAFMVKVGVSPPFSSSSSAAALPSSPIPVPSNSIKSPIRSRKPSDFATALPPNFLTHPSIAPPTSPRPVEEFDLIESVDTLGVALEVGLGVEPGGATLGR